jgi:hypothetical protein
MNSPAARGRTSAASTGCRESVMAFYSILFAILFLGAFGDLVHSFGVWDWPGVGMAATLTIVILNDVLYSSHFIEEEPRAYSIRMKVTDVITFMLLAVAVLVLQPTDHSVFQADPGPWFQSLPRAPVFWGMLILNWVMTIAWNLFGGFYVGQHVDLRIHLAMLGALLVAFVLSFFAIPGADVIVPFVMFIVFIFYTFVLKPIIFAEKKAAGAEVKTP